MSQKNARLKIFDNLGSCFRQDGETTVFSVTHFLRVNKLSDSPQLRAAVIEELRDMFPDVRIVEEEN
jgi:hypothetical protein